MIVAIAALLGTLSANAQIVRCEDASGKAVYRNASDCAKGKARGEVVQVYTPPPVVQPPMTKAQRDAAAAQKDAAEWKAMQERDLKATTEILNRHPPPKPLHFGPNAPGCGSGPGTPRC